jgi:hypothetical protein
MAGNPYSNNPYNVFQPPRPQNQTPGGGTFFNDINFGKNPQPLDNLQTRPNVTPNWSMGLPSGQQQQQSNSSSNGGSSGLEAFLSSPAGQAALGSLGSGLEEGGQASRQQQQLDLQGLDSATRARLQLFQLENDDQYKRSSTVLQNDPLGSEQRYAQKNALADAILPNLRNAHSTPGDQGVAAAMGGNRGGIMNILPEGGLDPDMVHQKFGSDATMAAILQHRQELLNVDPNAPTTNFKSLFGDIPGAEQNQQVINQWATQLQQAQGAQKQQLEAQVQQYIQKMADDEKGSGFWHRFAQIAGIVGAAAATYFTAGAASPLLGMAIGAGAGAASSWGNGGGAGDMAMGAGMGAGSQLAMRGLTHMGGGSGSTPPVTPPTGGGVNPTNLQRIMQILQQNPALAQAILRR